LYPEYIPTRYEILNERNNLVHLEETIAKADINYVDLKAIFSNDEEILYHLTDSHWNNKGAVLAHNSLQAAVDNPFENYENVAYEVRKDFDGDLYKMVFPLGNEKDNEVYYNYQFSYTYSGDDTSTEDSFVETNNLDKQGALLMFRDSYGNSLLPFMAEDYGKGYFLKANPYDLTLINAYSVDTVVIEIAERNVASLKEDIPKMRAGTRYLEKEPEIAYVNDMNIELEEDELYIKGMGKVDSNLIDSDGSIYVRLKSDAREYVYEATPMKEYEFGLYIPIASITEGLYNIDIITELDGGYVSSGDIMTYSL
jgi:hypothetical protein